MIQAKKQQEQNQQAQHNLHPCVVKKIGATAIYQNGN